MKKQVCRSCNSDNLQSLVNLGLTPLANSFLTSKNRDKNNETSYPLHLKLCSECKLGQLSERVEPKDVFSEYLYLSSYSAGWLDHAKRYCESIIEKCKLSKNSLVIELASNDGYLLKNFVSREIPVLGIEPAVNVAKIAEEKGVPTLTDFFSENCARDLKNSGRAADLIVANNVLAHVPDLNDFVSGIAHLLKPEGVVTVEFPHLMKLIQGLQFDTIYHEHYSYFSFISALNVFKRHGLRIFDVEELNTHGGSIRIYASKTEAHWPSTSTIDALLKKEQASAVYEPESFKDFSAQVIDVKKNLQGFLQKQNIVGKKVAAYGAAAKGNTLLNYCGVTHELISFVVDKNPHKQNLYLPGSKIPIYSPEKILQEKPDYILILPWNLKTEIMQSNSLIYDWGGKFVIALPQLEILS